MRLIYSKIAALQLIEQGKILLDSPVHPILPELANPVVLEPSGEKEPSFKPAEHEITVKHLLNHSSGLFYQPPLEGDPPDGIPAPLVGRGNETGDPISRYCSLIKVGIDYTLVLHYQVVHDFYAT